MNFKDSAEKFTKCCVCPCSYMFGEWHKETSIVNLPKFIKCKSNVFTEPMEFIIQLESSKEDYYHRIVHFCILTGTFFVFSFIKECKEYFSEISFHKIQKNLISCGEYNKTKKRSTPMYCYGSTITCTRFPKFFANGRPHILPRPYFTSKPEQNGYKIIHSSWYQSARQTIEENYFVKYSVGKKIIPESWHLGNSFFTHMSIFETLNKDAVGPVVIPQLIK